VTDTAPDRPLPVPPRPTPPPAINRELERAEQYAASALASSTRKAYERDWRVFATWCAEHGQRPLPASPATVAAFLAGEADREFRPVTITRRAAAIAAAHRAQDHPNPCDSAAVAQVLTGIRNTLGVDARQVDPLALGPLAQLLEPIPTSTKQGLRDRALLLLGFAAALRRSELVALDVEDLRFDVDRGLTLRIRKSKTDQERAGALVAVPYARAGNNPCAVCALQAWLQAAGIHRGPVFRQMRRGDTVTAERLSDQSVALIVKRRARAAGLPPEDLSGHSLRAGYATAAAAAGIEERKIANVTRHKNLPVLRRYIRTATAYDDVGEVL
jgi:site-specific recombinase XerD